MSAPTIRLVLNSPRRLLREVMCAYLSARPEFTVVGHSGTIDALTELLQLRRPDAALVDAVELTVPRVDVLRGLRRAAPGVEFIVSYTQASPQALTAAARAGLTALVPGSNGLDALLRSVRERARAGDGPDSSALTERDLRMLAMLSSGNSVQEIAAKLRLSARTVENHKRRLYVKLGVTTSGQAVSRAASIGLMEAFGGETQGGRRRWDGRLTAVIHGPTGPTLDAVWRTLLAAGVACVHTRDLRALDRDHWASWQRGPTVAVLVDPTYEVLLVPVLAGAPKVVVLTTAVDLATLVDLLLRGAGALVRADDVEDDLTSVLTVVAKGYVAMGAAYANELAWPMTAWRSEGPAVPVLTSRECDILGSIAAGCTIRQTARHLGIAAKTVENTQARLYRKLGARNRTEALAIAHRLRLVQPSGADPRP